MNKYILSKEKDYIIYEYNLQEDVIITWTIEKILYDSIEEICLPYCLYSYAIDAIIEDLQDEITDEDLERCKNCDLCSNIELDGDISNQELESIQELLIYGNSTGGLGVFDIVEWENSMLSDNKINKYLGEFKSIKECRETLTKDLLTFD